MSSDQQRPLQMTRRVFNATLLGAGVCLTASGAPANGVNERRLIEKFDGVWQFGDSGDGGLNRVAYSEEDQRARQYVRSWMEEAGLETRVDAGGNLIGRRAGRDSDRPLLMTGSHLDSVPHGGRYDGVVGTMAAVEVAHTLQDRGQRLSRDLEVVVFANEEGGQTGARAMAGRLSAGDLSRVSHSGLTVAEGIRAIGGDPDRLDDARRAPGEIAADIELHIEQGPVLVEAGVPIGIVEGIVGIHRWMVTVEGFANHAGTTPMDRRQDALLAASRFIARVNSEVRSVEGRQVGTVGWVEVEPGAPNVIPGRVRLTLEMRDLDWPKIDRIFERLREAAADIGRETGTDWSFEEIYNNPPRPTDARLRRFISEAAAECNLVTMELPSGAGHDAQSLSHICPIGMVFVPSRDGISHSPREFTPPEAIVRGANVLLGAIVKADAGL